MLSRQLPAAVSRSEALSSNWTNFPASAKVEGETAGPASGEVPKAGGEPGGSALESGADLRHADVTAVSAAETREKKWRREGDMFSPNHIVAEALGNSPARSFAASCSNQRHSIVGAAPDAARSIALGCQSPKPILDILSFV
jgi:hypothetical protein